MWMSPKSKRPKISTLHQEIPKHVQEFMQLTRLAEMGRVSASVAHEINNPLMIAQGFAENIEMLLDSPEIPVEDIRLQIQEIMKACQRISGIVNKMNRMSRHGKLRLAVVDLAEVALAAVDFLMQVSDIDAKIEFDFDSPMPIKCDVVQVEQMILNILSNAITALQENKGEKLIRISFSAVGDQWQQVRIWNNGPCIPEHLQEQIMSPFYTTKPDGVGLGLSVSKAIMDLHGGDLSFTSGAGNGTEFVLSFPRPALNPWQEQSQRVDRATVFILHGQVVYRQTLEEKFRLLGFAVRAFADFDQAIEAMSQPDQQIAGVFVDIIPGQLESIAHIEKLRQVLGASGLVFTISHFPAARELKSELKAAGATECFETPIHADNFSEILKLLDAAVAKKPAA